MGANCVRVERGIVRTVPHVTFSSNPSQMVHALFLRGGPPGPAYLAPRPPRGRRRLRVRGPLEILFLAVRGPGRFAEVGFPAPEFFGELFGFGVGAVEVTCGGVLLLVGLYARWKASRRRCGLLTGHLYAEVRVEGHIGIRSVRHAPQHERFVAIVPGEKLGAPVEAGDDLLLRSYL